MAPPRHSGARRAQDGFPHRDLKNWFALVRTTPAQKRAPRETMSPSGDRVVAAAAPGSAPQEPPHRQPRSSECAMPLNRLQRVRTARWLVAARRRKHRRHHALIPANRPQQQPLHDVAPWPSPGPSCPGSLSGVPAAPGGAASRAPKAVARRTCRRTAPESSSQPASSARARAVTMRSHPPTSPAAAAASRSRRRARFRTTADFAIRFPTA